MTVLNLRDLSLKGKRVLMRVDFNVPLSQEGGVVDNTRIKESLPSIEYALQQGASVVLMSHLGRPKGRRDPTLSLRPCGIELSELLGKPVQMATDCVGAVVAKQVHALQPGEVLLLENLRFYSAEEKPSLDPAFARELATFGDVYVNDAFGAAHRKHASTFAIASYFPQKAAEGFLMEKEIKALNGLLTSPKRPFYVLIGGAKISSKIGALSSLVQKADGLFIGGAMAFAFYAAQGLSVGDSAPSEDNVRSAEEIIQACKQKKIPLWLPKDIIIARSLSSGAECRQISIQEGIPLGWQGVDLGPATCQEWQTLFKQAETLFWNGPVGVFEIPEFAAGTRAVAQMLASSSALTVISGGDSLAAINALGLNKKFTHLSTGGGASLDYLESGHLPGIDTLSHC
jgi:phosphoglycerate kinase